MYFFMLRDLEQRPQWKQSLPYWISKLKFIDASSLTNTIAPIIYLFYIHMYFYTIST